MIDIECPHCHCRFSAWHRASINLELDDLDDEYLRANSVKKCPECGKDVHLDTLIVDEDGAWRFDTQEGNRD